MLDTSTLPQQRQIGLSSTAPVPAPAGREEAEEGVWCERRYSYPTRQVRQRRRERDIFRLTREESISPSNKPDTSPFTRLRHVPHMGKATGRCPTPPALASANGELLSASSLAEAWVLDSKSPSLCALRNNSSSFMTTHAKGKASNGAAPSAPPPILGAIRLLYTLTKLSAASLLFNSTTALIKGLNLLYLDERPRY